jgi:site-specific recombinase XerD
LRHTTGTELLRAGATLAEVAQILRHKSLATSALYANPRELHQMGGLSRLAC